METSRLADLHAYVDDCLEPDERLVFENADGAGSCAGASRRRVAIAKQRHSRGPRQRGRESLFDQHRSSPERSPEQGPTAGHDRRQTLGEQPARPSLAAVVDATRSSAEVGTSSALRRSLLWRLALAVVVHRTCLRLGSCRNRRPRQGTRRGRCCGFSRIRPSGRCAGRIGDRRQDRIGSVADDAAHAPRPPPRDPFRRQTDRRADRSLSRRAGGVSALPVPRQAPRVVDPVS